MRPQCPGRREETATDSNWEGYAWREKEDLRWDEEEERRRGVRRDEGG